MISGGGAGICLSGVGTARPRWAHPHRVRIGNRMSNGLVVLRQSNFDDGLSSSFNFGIVNLLCANNLRILGDDLVATDLALLMGVPGEADDRDDRDSSPQVNLKFLEHP